MFHFFKNLRENRQIYVIVHKEQSVFLGSMLGGVARWTENFDEAITFTKEETKEVVLPEDGRWLEYILL